MNDRYTIRTMTAGEVDQAVDWAAAEGWNPGLSDAGCFRAVDPDGFIGGWLNGRMISSISVVNYGDAYSFLGFYIVEEAHRGNGHGYALWQEAVKHAGDRLIGLDGVVAEQDNYRRSGFEFAYNNIRYGGAPKALDDAHVPSGVLITPLDGAAPDLADYDRKMFPAPRAAFLESWISTPGHLARAARAGDGGLLGYGVIRPCHTGFKIGPLFADDPAIARALARDLIAAADLGGQDVFLDVPEPNGDAGDLARDLALTPVFETARMYTGPAPTIDIPRIYGVTTFELG
ncbi:GNAT family N-acetyltransferase [Thalassospiraceae bacterium LMO-SO8]|nr:GNAT family N-acetyltransferase [Alphaproteobacteria bacterium LMO-S08]WND75042.1 GNAT family N-acetyltransferase [Thalassospiraceae bacterium LMO-SO8]